MAGLERFDDKVWDRFFEFITPDVEAMSRSEIRWELDALGIDTTKAFARVTAALDAVEGKATLARARTERIAGIKKLSQVVLGPVENARKTLAEMIAAKVPSSLRAVYNRKLEKVATDADVQSLLDDLAKLDAFESGGADGQS